MTDLRLRLIAALHGADCACQDTPTHFAAQYTPQADAALSVFAEWLRERADAEAERREREVLVFEPARESEGAEAALRVAADEIAPKGDGRDVVA